MTPEQALYRRIGPLVDGLAPTRARFAATYDDWLADSALPEAPANFIHAVIVGAEGCGEENGARPDPADVRDAMRLALAALGQAEHAHACFCAAVGAGLFDYQFPPAQQALAELSGQDLEVDTLLRRSSPELFDDTEDAPGGIDRVATGRKILTARAQVCLDPPEARAYLQRANLQRARHQALTAPDDFWTDPGSLLPALLHGRRRLCLIRTYDAHGDETTGTGFLVGPSAVLTNWHVVQAMDGPLDDPTLIEVEFDFSETTALLRPEKSVFHPVPDWCVARGMIADPGPDQDYWWDDRTRRKAWLEQVAGQLDFAIIRLDGAPGLQRGWYPLETRRRRRPSGSWALHHPAQREHTLTRGQVKYTVDFGHRIFHTASTVGGSSGGLILDQDGAPMGLHYMALEARDAPAPGQDTERNQVVNVAIGLREIAQALESEGTLEEVLRPGVLRPVNGCIEGTRPVFGRTDLFDKLTRCWTSDSRRILRIDLAGEAEGFRRGGKTFSSEIIRSLFRGPEHHHILFRAGDIRVDAKRVAADALMHFAEDLIPELPGAPDTTTPAYVRKLVKFLGKAIRDRLAGRSVWIVLDDLDKHDLSDASGREFLATLYHQVEQIEGLRIVLIGLPQTVEVSGLRSANLVTTRITANDLQGLEQKFIAWIKERGGHASGMTDEGFDFLARVATSFATGASPLESLSSFVADHVAPVAADRFDGSAGGGR
ncbi:trypsin-like peptidase domain-containing protein [Ferrimonas balearica]|nr:trypsin-like peptidase domain-containing protein [Ferrimonas balearica]